jgi:hypothetical protein
VVPHAARVDIIEAGKTTTVPLVRVADDLQGQNATKGAKVVPMRLGTQNVPAIESPERP